MGDRSHLLFAVLDWIASIFIHLKSISVLLNIEYGLHILIWIPYRLTELDWMAIAPYKIFVSIGLRCGFHKNMEPPTLTTGIWTGHPGLELLGFNVLELLIINSSQLIGIEGDRSHILPLSPPLYLLEPLVDMSEKPYHFY